MTTNEAVEKVFSSAHRAVNRLEYQRSNAPRISDPVHVPLPSQKKNGQRDGGLRLVADISAVTTGNFAHDGGKRFFRDTAGGNDVNTGHRSNRQDSMAGFGRPYSRSRPVAACQTLEKQTFNVESKNCLSQCKSTTNNTFARHNLRGCFYKSRQLSALLTSLFLRKNSSAYLLLANLRTTKSSLISRTQMGILFITNLR